MKFVIAVIAVFVSSAVSQDVEYVFSGTGNGLLGEVSFFDTEFSITLTGDESDIFQTPEGYDKFIDASATFSIDGIAQNVLFTTSISVVVNHSTNSLVLGNFGNHRALAIMDNEEFVGYDLRGFFGPVTEYEPRAINQFMGVSTEMGFLGIPDMSEISYRAVPSPSSTIALLFGVGVISCRRNRL